MRRHIDERRIALIDDDPSFCKIMESFAESRGIAIDCFTSLKEMGPLSRLPSYAAALVDFDLGPIKGIEIADYLSTFFGDMAVVLISGRHRNEEPGQSWPRSIKSFAHKDDGPDALLDAALSLMERGKNQVASY